MTNPTKTRRRFTAQQKQEAIELCLREELSCNAVAQRLGLSTSSLAKWNHLVGWKCFWIITL
jgi:transposase-like protein